MFSSILDPVLSPLLSLHPLAAILIISSVISIVTLLVYKKITNQPLMKSLRDEIKELQKEMKELKDNPKKLTKINDRFMETNSKYMMESMKPNLVTILPILLIFGWLNTHFGYYPLFPNQPFEVMLEFDKGVIGNAELILPEGLSAKGDLIKEVVGQRASWIITGSAGEYELQFKHADTIATKTILVTTERKYIKPEEKPKHPTIDKIIVGNLKVMPFIDVPVLNQISFIRERGWLSTYIFFSLIFSMSLRRLLKIS